MTIKELIKLVIQNESKIIEVQLVLNFAYATHFIFFDKAKNKLVDEGIDGEPNQLNIKTFYEHYRKVRWIINQIV